MERVREAGELVLLAACYWSVMFLGGLALGYGLPAFIWRLRRR